METKKWWLSKTIVLNAVALVASVLSAGGVVDIGLDTQQSIGASLFNAISIWLRFKTSAPVSVT